jgi:hypothetical protein
LSVMTVMIRVPVILKRVTVKLFWVTVTYKNKSRCVTKWTRWTCRLFSSANEYTIKAWRQWRQKRCVFSFFCWPCEKRPNSVKTIVPTRENLTTIFLLPLSAL